MTFSETNDGAQPIVVLTGPNSFQISQDGTAIWDADPTPPGAFPAQELGWTTLWPGQSYTQTAKWDGWSNVGVLSRLTGPFTFANEFDTHTDAASFQIVPTLYIPPPIPTPVAAILVPNRSIYKPGQTIGLSMTLKNTSAAKVKVAPKTAVDGIMVMDGSTVVYRSSGMASPLVAGSIKPHSSIKLALNWSGRPNQSGIKRLSPGTYTVQVVEGGYTATATIRIVGRA
jgi:hypothetical protein